LLDGSFNEDDSAASFAEALNAWRSGDGAANANAGGAAARPSRFTVRGAAAPTSTEPTLADKVHALKSELGLPMDASLVEAVRAANAAVGLDNIGTLADQVGRLLRQTGVKPTPGCAPVAKTAAAAAESGTACGSRPGSSGSSSRPGTASGAGTQTQQGKTFYERYLEQQRKDGVR